MGPCFLVITAVINIGTPLLLPIHWIAAHSLLPGYKLSVAGGFVVGWVVYSFFYYMWHRFQHRNALVWRLMHQLHHSMARVDAAGFAILHPLDILSLTLLSIAVTVGILGLDPDAAALVGLYGAIAALAQHLNIKTPEWLEWFMQRREAHLQHHEYGVHAGNYSDLPLLDKLFGTYRAPAAVPSARYGFDAAAEGRWGAMLAGVDVNAAVTKLDTIGGNKLQIPSRPQDAERASFLNMSTAFSATMATGAVVLPLTIRGMMDASTTRRPTMPCTRSRAFTTSSGLRPMRQLPYADARLQRIYGGTNEIMKEVMTRAMGLGDLRGCLAATQEGQTGQTHTQ